MARRWQEHIPLTYLTDKFCTPGGDTKLRNKDFEVDQRSGLLVPAEQPLNDTNENKLSFEDWHQAWLRFLELLRRYTPNIYPLWKTHFELIYSAPDHISNWPTWLAYDITIRRQSLNEGIDPSIFHMSVWSSCDLEVTKQAVSRTASSLSNTRPNSASGCFQPYTNNFRHPERQNSQQDGRLRPHQTRWRSPAHCLFCAGPHQPRGCRATVQVNGRPLYIISRDDGKAFADAEGNRYCFAFNGSTGCSTSGCSKGVHHCTLCGGTDHGAQSCLSV